MAKNKSLKHALTQDFESEAFDLLREVVNLSRNNEPYKESLVRLKEVLNKAPGVKRVISERISHLG